VYCGAFGDKYVIPNAEANTASVLTLRPATQVELRLPTLKISLTTLPT